MHRQNLIYAAFYLQLYFLYHHIYRHLIVTNGNFNFSHRASGRALIGGGGIFLYSVPARLVSFEIKLISKDVSRAEPEYMNIHPPISVLATALFRRQ